jgi:phospholipid/cholesterol/gamma-HCH transport system permease protein
MPASSISASWPRRLIERAGARTISTLEHIGSAALLVLATVRFIFARPFFFSTLMTQFANVGVHSLPVVTITGVCVGMVLSLQGYHQLKLLGSEGMLGGFVSSSTVKELGVMLTAFVLSGRIGAAITAELGTMKVTEQVDAIEAMGTSPIQYLVVPRFLACAFMLPVLTVYSNILGIVGGYIIAVVFLDVPGGAVGMSGEFFLSVASSVNGFDMEDVMTGLIKATTFGMTIATIGCYMGFSVAPTSGAEGVGKATTNCAVFSLVLILVFDFVINFAKQEVLGF